MKSLRVFLCLLVAGALMTACQKNNVEELGSSKIENANSSTTKLSLENSSLEALNKLFEDNGLAPITLDEFSLTELEYVNKKEQSFNKEVARSRGACPSHIITTFNDDGDMNGSGLLTGFDIVLARRVILGLDPPSDASDDFGTLSWTWNFSNSNLSSYDLFLAAGFVNDTLCP